MKRAIINDMTLSLAIGFVLGAVFTLSGALSGALAA